MRKFTNFFYTKKVKNNETSPPSVENKTENIQENNENLDVNSNLNVSILLLGTEFSGKCKF